MRHDNIAKILHRKVCEKWWFNKTEKWYINKPEKVLECDDCKILWDLPIETDKTIKHNRPDVTVVDKKSKKCLLIVQRRENKEKWTNYSVLMYEIAKTWIMRNVEVIPIVTGALRTVTKHLEKWIDKVWRLTHYRSLVYLEQLE